ncbi:MAG: hypothetical protein KGO53_14720 [Alphaproteobacteria bacterium]|nr:hypothetical protein [Alphaproteobacteria bacterium]
MLRVPELPKLVVFIIRWTAIGAAGGLAAMVAVLALNIGGLRVLLEHSSSPWIVLYILGNSFAVSGATLSVGIAVWVREDFGGRGEPPNPRLERWKAGGSALILPEDEDRPLP